MFNHLYVGQHGEVFLFFPKRLINCAVHNLQHQFKMLQLKSPDFSVWSYGHENVLERKIKSGNETEKLNGRPQRRKNYYFFFFSSTAPALSFPYPSLDSNGR